MSQSFPSIRVQGSTNWDIDFKRCSLKHSKCIAALSPGNNLTKFNTTQANPKVQKFCLLIISWSAFNSFILLCSSLYLIHNGIKVWNSAQQSSGRLLTAEDLLLDLFPLVRLHLRHVQGIIVELKTSTAIQFPFFCENIYSFTKTTAQLNPERLYPWLQHVRHIKTLKSSQITRERDLCYHRRCVSDDVNKSKSGRQIL